MSSANSRIGDWLGMPPPAAELDVLRVIEIRLDPLAVERLVAAGLDPDEIDAAIIPKRSVPLDICPKLVSASAFAQALAGAWHCKN